ncbi:FadD3 family acyl-CoA ligase [Acidiferrimicrobium sp. IK]|uniref:FadD3 family acyl-CoA ligase n=1 Tax=Acidiferrimicrobium sp. IK TaxID=2871700 RepID=UPI0021CB2A6A|nr:FadD3 family acyl-CoA ligase [Acidiferrimicrobium sp. IK]MCU4184198.1 FadD3 family acyl-CoA ligase [Acidiferrimicrobium sp. IK]
MPALLAARAAETPGAVAVVDGDTVLTYGDLAGQARSFAAGLVEAGIAVGDRVAIWAPNSAAWIVSMLGIWSAGAVLVPLNTRYRAREAADILRRSGARMLLSVGDFLGRDYPAELVGHDLPALRDVLALDGRGEGPAPGGRRRRWEEGLSTDPAATAEVLRRVETLAGADAMDVMFTSGTTGRPKGVQAAHGPVLRAYRYYADALGIRADDRYLLVNPLFHSFGSRAGVVAALCAGASIFPVATFDPARAAELIAGAGITVLPGPPTVYQSLLALPAGTKATLRSLRLAVTGAAAVPVTLLARMADELGFDTVLTAYGLTECGGLVTMCRAGDPPEVVSRTSGRPIPGVEIAVVDPGGRRLPAGVAGEVVVRGYVVMTGYVDDPVATKEVLDDAGWLRTGDVGVIDEDGGLRITDRLKDMFIVGGFNAYPAEIEAALVRHPSVAAAAVVGVPDTRLGEVGHAFVVGRPGCHVEAAEVLEWCRGELANFKVPRAVTVVPALPTNASGKVVKDELRRLAGAGAGGEQ